MRTLAPGPRLPTFVAVGIVGLLAGAAVAQGAPRPPTVTPELRVEPGGAAWSGATHYATGTVRFRADTRPACGGTGRRRTVRGPNALGIVYDARASRSIPGPVRTTDRFAEGDFLCGIGRLLTGTTRYWDVRVNLLTPAVGASEVSLRSRDRVLWFYANTESGQNTGAALDLQAPARARAGQPVSVSVLAHDGAGGIAPAAGAHVAGAVADANGRATIVATSRRSLILRATRSNDIASAPVSVCLSKAGRPCAKRRGWSIIGRNTADRLRGTGAPDRIDGRGGGDWIFVRGGGRDTLRCGPGRDTVIASRDDRVARDCERVQR